MIEEGYNADVIFKLYKATESYPLDEDNFVAVYNEGTEKFQQLKLKAAMDKVPWKAPTAGSQKGNRGNVNTSAGFAGGVNNSRTGSYVDPGDCGTSKPNVTISNDEYLPHFAACDEVAKIIGLPYTSHAKSVEEQERYDRFAGKWELEAGSDK